MQITPLDRSAAGAAPPAVAGASSAPIAVVAFAAAGVACCLPLAEVERVLFLPATDPLPGAPRWVSGLLQLPGESLPVIDLALRLGAAPGARHDLDTPLLLCRRGALAGALLVERVEGLREQVVAVAEGGGARNNPLFRGSYRDPRGTLLMLELEQALSLAVEDRTRPVEAFLLADGARGRS
ncbi:chemotaxis protein CheW [Endothiovibrio diazotrophicus]